MAISCAAFRKRADMQGIWLRQAAAKKTNKRINVLARLGKYPVKYQAQQQGQQGMQEVVEAMR